jgi:hypothetical protein
MSEQETNDWFCPNCSAAWGLEWFADQSCDSCGYPDSLIDEFEEDDHDDYYNEHMEEPPL